MTSKESDSYATDTWLKDLFKDWFDPCTLSNGELRALDGLGSSWRDRTYVNPPYSNPLPWCIKAVKENQEHKTIALLLKVDTSTRWFKVLQEGGARFLWVNGRLKFHTGEPANFPSMIAILEKQPITEQTRLI